MNKLAVIVPTKDSPDVSVLVFNEIENSKYTLAKSGVAKVELKSPKVVMGEEAEEVSKLLRLESSVRVPDKVVFLSANEALYLKNSSVFGYSAVKAPVIKGIKNSKYSLFSRVASGKVADKYGNQINSSSDILIASPVSNRSLSKGAPRDLFSEMEIAYIKNLRSLVSTCISRSRELSALVKSQETLKSELQNLKVENRQLKQSLSQSELSLRESKFVEVSQSKRDSTNKNVDFLTRIMCGGII